MRRKKRSSSSEEPIVNLTPLIDVVFVILFTFIVVAPLLEVDEVQLAGAGSAKSKHTTPEKHSPVAIHVFGDDSIAYNQEKCSLSQLEMKLRGAKRKYPGVRPQLFHDKKATFGTYQGVKNAVESAGFSELDVILKP
jgi:biopolymer transport protein ExbD